MRYLSSTVCDVVCQRIYLVEIYIIISHKLLQIHRKKLTIADAKKSTLGRSVSNVWMKQVERGSELKVIQQNETSITPNKSDADITLVLLPIFSSVPCSFSRGRCVRHIVDVSANSVLVASDSFRQECGKQHSTQLTTYLHFWYRAAPKDKLKEWLTDRFAPMHVHHFDKSTWWYQYHARHDACLFSCKAIWKYGWNLYRKPEGFMLLNLLGLREGRMFSLFLDIGVLMTKITLA